MLNNYWREIWEEVDESNMDRIHLRRAIGLLEEAIDLLEESGRELFGEKDTTNGIREFLEKVGEKV